MNNTTGKPKIRLSSLSGFSNTEFQIHSQGIHTICESGLCPNKRECWGRGTATFMILGNICTRACKFCGVATGKPMLPDMEEPLKLAKTIKDFGLKHVVLTSVDRDDLPDYGAAFWCQTITTIRALNPNCTIETLIPDFKGNEALLDTIIAIAPQIVSHNMETVRALTPKIRSVATYDTSLKVLTYLSSKGIKTKSGIMLGLGETIGEVLQTIIDIRSTGCSILTIGQYFQPSKAHFPVQAFLPKEVYDELKVKALELGFKYVESGILVRSSYHAETHL
jgi:lipoic acid synthetase